MTKYSEKITYQDSAYPTPQEKRIARILVDSLGKSILFLAPDRRQGIKTPDIRIGNQLWEIKSPKGSSSRTIENNFRTAVKQSPNVIFDLSIISIPTNKAISHIKKQFTDNKSAKNIIIITKTREIIDLKR